MKGLVEKVTMGILRLLAIALVVLYANSCAEVQSTRIVSDFNSNWAFHLGDVSGAISSDFDHSSWKFLSVPHDWSIEGEFREDHPATEGGGALPGGIGWYRKTFKIDQSNASKKVFVQFDGIYMNSEVWINGNYLGKRPFGYISFEYELTPYLNFGEENNIIAVKVDNSQQPNSRWYSGSGIYRNTRLVFKEDVYVPQWGSYVTTPTITEEKAVVKIETKVLNTRKQNVSVNVLTTVYNRDGSEVANHEIVKTISSGDTLLVEQLLDVTSPRLWNLDDPYLYTAISEVTINNGQVDKYETNFGIRQFNFDQSNGFSLNNNPIKIKGVCMHHDLGCLGSAVNVRAMERQLEILRGMGVNAIRTSHNPPAPEYLDLCDQMGFLVMDETFDIWSMKKSPYDYSLYWDKWHKKDLKDHILRDRNHPSVFSWSIGNEIIDQWHDEGEDIAIELAEIVRSLDPTRSITAAMNPPVKDNNTIARSGALDLMGYNYHHHLYEKHNDEFPTTPFIATETTSALATRGYYDQKSDTLKRWPIRWDLEFTGGNPGNTVSAYDQVSAPWGSTHEETWKIIKKNDFMSGMFIWTGFDYIGEPTPYTWPSRSSYFGVVDLAGFPKDSYYMYQSEWTDQDVLHVFPHWNWPERDSVDVWAYFNADEVELFLNGKSLGSKSKEGDELHAMWRVAYEPGVLKAISRTNGNIVLEKEIRTASRATSIRLIPDRQIINADGKDLSFITVEVLDDHGVVVPNLNSEIKFSIDGVGEIVGVDNGDPTSHISLKGNKMKIFNGKCLVVVQSNGTKGSIALTAKSEGLQDAKLSIQTK